MKTLIVLICLAIGVLLMWMTVPAHALGLCGSRADFIAAITGDKYQEEKNGAGIAGEVALVELFASRSGGTFTVLMTMPNGKSCIIASGKGWIAVVPKIPGDDT